MSQTVVIKKSDNSIEGMYEGSPNQGASTGPWETDAYEHVAVPEGEDWRQYIYDGDALVEDDDKKAAALDEDKNVLRMGRDELLKLTDFTQVADAPLTTQEVTDWATYRQALRDITTQLSAFGDTVTWPTPPSTPTINGVNDA